MKELTIVLCFLFVGTEAAHTTPAHRGLDLSGEKGETVFFILGMLYDFGGRNIVQGRVEHFFCGEESKVAVFRTYLERFAEEQDLDPTIVEFKFQSCLVDLMSVELTHAVDSFYRYSIHGESEYHDRVVREWGGGQIRADKILQARRKLRLAYMCGAYFRWGNDETLRFGREDRGKTKLMKELLESLGCEVHVTTRYGARRLGFRPTTDILKGALEYSARDR